MSHVQYCLSDRLLNCHLNSIVCLETAELAATPGSPVLSGVLLYVVTLRNWHWIVRQLVQLTLNFKSICGVGTESSVNMRSRHWTFRRSVWELVLCCQTICGELTDGLMNGHFLANCVKLILDFLRGCRQQLSIYIAPLLFLFFFWFSLRRLPTSLSSSLLPNSAPPPSLAPQWGLPDLGKFCLLPAGINCLYNCPGQTVIVA
jgi:hypothetical protein